MDAARQTREVVCDGTTVLGQSPVMRHGKIDRALVAPLSHVISFPVSVAAAMLHAACEGRDGDLVTGCLAQAHDDVLATILVLCTEIRVPQ
jgi:hypothetical protein